MMERDLDRGIQMFSYSLPLAHADRKVGLALIGQERAIWQSRNYRAKDGFKRIVCVVPIIWELFCSQALIQAP